MRLCHGENIGGYSPPLAGSRLPLPVSLKRQRAVVAGALLLPEYLQVQRNSGAKNPSGQIEINAVARRLAARESLRLRQLPFAATKRR